MSEENQIELLHEQLETWRELTESLELRDKEQQLQKVEQELKYTNGELGKALMVEKLKFNDAKEVAKKNLAN